MAAGGYGQPEEMVGYQTLWRELAYFIMSRQEQYERAVKYFDEALSKTPEDKRALMGRSLARAKACQYQGALDDINKALTGDPTDLVVLARKALNTYLSCEFEEALIQNIRMVPERKKPDNFVMGVMHCTEAIENCLGTRAGRPLRDHFKIIRKLAWKLSYEQQKPYVAQPRFKKKKKKKKPQKEKKVVREPVAPTRDKKTRKSAAESKSGATAPTDGDPDLEIRDSVYSHDSEQNIIPPYSKPFPFKPLQNYTTNIENYMAEKYLDSMYLDKIFLKNLQYEPGIKCPNKAGSKKIYQLSKYGYKTLCYNQELLRTRRPFYFIKYQEAQSTGALRERQLAELKKLQMAATKDADDLVLTIENHIKNKQSRFALECAEKLKLFCDSKPKKILPEREMYLHKMYDLVCDAHFILKRLNKNYYEWDNEKRIYNALGLPSSREPSRDSIINQFKDVFVDWGKQIFIYEARMRKATSPEEMAWLYHELSRFNCETKQYELSRVYARKCIKEGRKCDNLNWVINALMLIIKVNLLQHNKNDAKVELNDAINLAKSMKNNNLVEYLVKCLQVVDKVDFEDVSGPKVLEKREKKIIEMMAESEMKGEAAYLFRKMSVMPAARRMSVMPGVRLEDDEKPTMAQRKMSIMPGPKEESEVMMPRSSRKSAIGPKSGETNKGVGFMELIQYHID